MRKKNGPLACETPGRSTRGKTDVGNPWFGCQDVTTIYIGRNPRFPARPSRRLSQSVKHRQVRLISENTSGVFHAQMRPWPKPVAGCAPG